MSKIEILELLQQDINDLNGIINYDEYVITKEAMKKHARGILLNLEEHLEQFIQY